MEELLDYLIQELLKEDSKYAKITIPSSYEDKKDLYRALRNVRLPKPISEEYLKRQDQFLQEEIRKKGIVEEKSILFDKDIFSIWRGDITTLKVDVIVNACNEYLLGCFQPNHFCIDNAIHSFAGMQLREECNQIMKGKTLPSGEVVLTKGYNLPCHYVIQTVGPKVSFSVTEKNREDLKNCYYHSLELMREKGLKTVAFPCISTGLYGFPQEEACQIVIHTVEDYLKKYPNSFQHIIFNVFKEEDNQLYHKYLLGEEESL